MADFLQYLAILDSDPDDAAALAGLIDRAAAAATDPAAPGALGATRKNMRERGRPEVVLRLLDLELRAVTDKARRADLLLEKAQLLEDDLLDEDGAIAALKDVLSLRDDETALELIEQIEETRANWQKVATKFIDEASVATDRQLATTLFTSAAEIHARCEPGSAEIEKLLRRALEADPRNRKPAAHLERLLRAGERWVDLAAHLEQRIEVTASRDERIAALLGLAELSRTRLSKPEASIELVKKVIALDPGQPQALKALGDAYENEENWQGLVMLYSAALKARRGSDREELAMLLQVGMVLWRRLGDLDAAEEYFRRIRKVEPAHPAALDFYRAYYPARGEGAKLLQLLRQTEKQLPPMGSDPVSDSRLRALAIEIAELAEAQLGNPDKAIEAWKQLLRQDPTSREAREALKRLFRRGEKWNPLLDMMKEDIDRLPEDDVRGKVERLNEVVEIYRTKLKGMDPMVINTLSAILKIDPDNRAAMDELAEKYRQQGKWNDLIGVLGRKAEVAEAPILERVTLLKEVADLWIDRFGNHAQAIRPLERLLELAPSDADTLARLKDIYTRRRQWRQLIGLLSKEADALPAAEKRGKMNEMARLAAERVGDNRLAIELHNQVLAEFADSPEIGETLAALAALYERDKRWLAYGEILRRQRERATSPAEAVQLLEKLGAMLSDRVGAPAQAAEVFSEILKIDPGHARSLRTLRELYAAAGDYDGLERLYGGLGQWDELVDALGGIADRVEDRNTRLAVLERAAGVAEKRAAATSGAAGAQASDKVARVWERVMGVDPNHITAARALAPIYARQEKWARLLPVLEVQLAAAPDRAARLAGMLEIRELCEAKLGSKVLAFTWAARAFETDPSQPALEADLLRLAQAPEQWNEIAALLDRVVGDAATPDPVRLRVLRTAAKVAATRLSRPDRARDHERRILELAPDDPEAVGHLEDLAMQLSDWPALVASVERRASREKDPAAQLELSFRVAQLQEERLVDLDAAADTYEKILGKPKLPPALAARALAALARLHEARGDWEGLDGVLVRQLADADPKTAPDVRAALLMRMGSLEETGLDKPAAALGRYLEAVRLVATAPALNAAERFLDGGGLGKSIPAERRAEVAEVLLPHLEQAGDPARLARALEILRGSSSTAAGTPLEVDRRLLNLYDLRLADPTRAWDAAVRILAGEVSAGPADARVRATLHRLGANLGREADLARHLNAALASRKAAGAPPAEIRELAAELASLHGDRLGDAAAAERDWLIVLEAEPEAADAFDALGRMYRSTERWPDLRALLELRAETTLDDGLRKTALLELAMLEDTVLADSERAIAAHRRVIDVDPAHLDSYRTLERLYAETQHWAELEDLLGRELDHVPEKAQVDLQYRRAELRGQKLGNFEGAVDLLEEVVSRRKGHADARELLEELLPQAPLRLRVARILEPLYEGDSLWKDLVMVLRAQHQLAATSGEKVELLARIAAAEEDHLGNPRSAFDTWVEALVTDPSDDRARDTLPRLAGSLDRWSDAAAAWEKALAAASPKDVALRVALLADLGTFYDARLGDSSKAVAAYGRLAAADPTNPEVVRRAATALARLHEDDERWGELRDVLRKLAEWAESPAERKQLLGRIAWLEEHKLAAKDAALATWRDVLSEDPEDTGALGALERMYQTAEKWPELVEILRRRVDIADAPADKKLLLGQIAEYQEVMLDKPAESIAAHLEILDHVPDDLDSMVELARLYRAGGRHQDLIDSLERRLATIESGAGTTARADGGGDPIELRFEIANLLAGPLGREREALDRMAEVLILHPDHVGARAAVEKSLDDDELREPAAEILRPLYEATAQDDKLAALLERLATGSEDLRDRLRYLREVAHLREKRLGDRPGAFAALVRALEVSVTEPELAEVLADVDRLASDLGRESDLIDIYRKVAPEVLDGEVQRRMYLDVADLARGVRDDVGLAREHYQKVLDGQPDDRRALLALESIYRETGEHARLWEILSRKAELAAGDPDERVASLAEAAALCAGPLGRPDEAIVGWEQVLELAPERKDAVGALEQLYRSSSRWHDLVDLLERRLGFTFTMEEAVELRLRLGEVHEKELRDSEAAVDSYAAALGGDPSNPAAIAALERFLDDPQVRGSAAEVLEPLYVSRHAWAKLIRIYEIKLEAATDPGDRLRLTRYIARLYEEQLEDLDGAARWYARLFRENPIDPSTRDQLQRLAAILDSWKFLAEVYQGWLDDEGGESPTVRDVAVTLATVYDRRLDAIEQGAAAYRRALATPVPGADQHRSPDGSRGDDRELFSRLEAMLTRASRWPLLIEVYEEQIAAGGESRRRSELLARMASVHEEKLGDRYKAIDAWREILGSTGDDAAMAVAWNSAAGELDRLFRVESLWYDLADLLNSRIDRIPEGGGGDGRRAELRLALAEVLEAQLGDVPGAIDQYEQVLRSSVGWDKALPNLERLVVRDEHRERITELLEPVYRKWDWWQKLVVILDAKLQYIDDPSQKVATLREIATIHDSRGGDLGLAFDALARAWKSEPSDSAVFDALTHQAARLGAWDDLVEVLQTGVVASYDPEVAAAVHGRIAEIHESQRGDHGAAITSWRKVLEQRSDDPVALSALDRLLAIEGRAEELVTIIERRAELADDAGVRLVLLHRVASLYEEDLARPKDAINAYKNVLGVDDSDEAALDALEKLYRQVGDHHELASVLSRKIELVRTPEERRALRLAAARVHETDLGDVFEALAQLQAVLGENAGDGEALAELDRLYGREKMWPELLEIVDRRALLATDANSRAELAFRAAGVVEKELLEAGDAIGRYGAILQIQPGHPGARAALEGLLRSDDHVDAAGAVLERLYRSLGEPDALVSLYERRLAVPGDQEQRHGQWAALAEIHELMRDDLAAATQIWARALAETPDDLSLFGPLERLAGERGAWPELAGILDQRLAQLSDPELELAYATRLGQIHEDAIGDAAAAVTAYRRALSVSGDERGSLASLDRVLLRSGRHQELTEVLAREADAAPDDAHAADFLFRLGDVRETALADVGGAIEGYRDALTRVPQHRAARGSLERLLGTADDHRASIIDVLEPIYEDDGDWQRLADLLASKLSVTADHHDRATIYQRIAEISESRLRDAVRALDAAGGWLAEDPSSGEALAEVERLAALLGRWGEVAARLSGIVGSGELDRDVRLGLLLRLGVVQLDRIGDVPGATKSFTAALELEPESPAALESLERIHRGMGDTRSLAAVLARRGELSYEPAAKRGAFAEVADLRERMGDVPGAVAAWKTVLELDEADREALDRTAQLHERAGEHRALVDILEQTARHARDAGEEKQLRIRIARLEGDVLQDTSRAVAAWQAVLDVDPTDRGALEMLETMHGRAGDWPAVQEILTRRLDQAQSSAEKVQLLGRMAKVAEEGRGSVDDAIGDWFAVLDVDNAQVPAYDQLERLLAKGERWHDLVELLERRAEVEGTLGNNDGEIQSLARAADVWEAQLDNPDAAGEILEKILRREPGSVTALTRLARIYERAADWEKCSEVLQKALALGPRGRDAADLFFRLGEVANKTSGDLDTAQAHWRQALTHDPAHPPTIASLEKLARDRSDWATLADLLARREPSATTADARLALALELAEVHGKLGNPAAAIPVLAKAAAAAPGDIRVLGPLADLYFADGRLDEAAPIYDKLAEEAKAARRMKDVAKFRQRQAGILEKRGDVVAALAAYEEAFRVNPSDIPTLAGLGRIYLEQKDWEKARKVYSSLMLQNFNSDAGLTKAEVYHALGVIFIELGQAPKAKGMFQRGLEIEPGNARLKEALSRIP